ncbi:hypothetical protein GCM10011381_40160 [Klenkia taihuensis]|nr:hypothetical protein GCM10011381_40160 [Klenkia taihuensis]
MTRSRTAPRNTDRRFFDTEGVKGASLAQRDAFRPPGAKMVDFVVPELIHRGHWTHAFARDGVARALAADLPPYQRRWFAELEDNLQRIGDRSKALDDDGPGRPSPADVCRNERPERPGGL